MYDISAAEEPVTHLQGYSIHKGEAFLYQREAGQKFCTHTLCLSFKRLNLTKNIFQVTRGTEEERGCRPVTVQFEKYTVVQIKHNSPNKKMYSKF